MGIELEEIDNKTARKLNIDGGLRITKILPGKLKRQTDMREGFIITHVDNRAVDRIEEFIKILEDRENGVIITGIYEDYPGQYYYAFGL